jgi:hypothetical protein
MAKQQGNAPAATNEASNPATSAASAAPAAPAAAPAGYKKAATDAIGFFDGDMKLPIHFIPLHVNLSDSQIEKEKPSALIFGRLLEPCEAIRSAEGDAPVANRPTIPTKKDDVIGIWFSQGMRDLAMAGGVPTFMVYEKDTPIKGKPSPMKTYGVYTQKPGKLLPVREDRRKESKHVDPKPFVLSATAGVAAEPQKEDDTIPF